MNKKYLIVRYGPPASGKSKIIDMVKKEYNIDKCFMYDIDSAVENKNDYQKEIQKCIRYYQSVDKQEDLDPDKIKKCSSIYFNHRDAKVFNKLDAGESDARRKGMSIIYETTGCTQRHIDFIKEAVRSYRKAGYIIVLYYPLVPLGVLKERAFKRAQMTGRYVRDICASDAVQLVKNLIDYVDDIYFYNNTNPEPKFLMIWKSTTREVYCNQKELKFFSEYKELYQYIIELYRLLCNECYHCRLSTRMYRTK